MSGDERQAALQEIRLLCEQALEVDTDRTRCALDLLSCLHAPHLDAYLDPARSLLADMLKA